MYRTLKTAGTAALLAGGVSLTACDGTVDVGLQAESSVSFAVAEGGGLLGGEPNEVSSGGHAITITQATLTASDFRVSGTSEATQSGRATVNLPVEGGVVTPVRLRLNAGTYDELRMRVETVRVRGTYDGTPFDITVSTNSETRLDVFPAVRVEDGGSSNLSVRVDLRQWFRAESGALMEPSAIRGDSSLEATLRSNIEASLRAFEDEDQDGSET